MSFRRVVAHVPADVVVLGLGLAGAVFRPRPGLTDFEFSFCADRPGRVTTDLGTSVVVDHGVDALQDADLVLLLPGGHPDEPPSRRLVAALRSAHERGALLAAHCLGVFTLAATGLLDGREATTHWQHTSELAARHPLITVRAEELYVDEGSVATGAGAAAGMDLYLHLVRREHGAALANAIASLLVVPPHRSGGQQQYISRPVPAEAEGMRFAEVLDWARANLHQSLPVDVLAARALMSRRSFIRHFKSAIGTTPHAWLRVQRLTRAEELLETTPLSTDQIAERVGYRSAAVMREQFKTHRGVSPSHYRRTFTHT